MLKPICQKLKRQTSDDGEPSDEEEPDLRNAQGKRKKGANKRSKLDPASRFFEIEAPDDDDVEEIDTRNKED